MSIRRGLSIAVLAAALIAMAMGWEVARSGYAVAFVWATAPIAGAVLLLAVGRVTGARWAGFGYFWAVWWLLIPAALLLGLARSGQYLPPHLLLWQSGWAVAIRGGLFAALLVLGGMAIARRPGTTAAAVLLALYVAVVTPVAYDWLLGGVPGHAASAAGMMLAVQQIGGGAALGIIAARDVQVRRDLARLGIAAALGLGYLTFMDYLIVWYGDLPSRVGFYALRGSTGPALLAGAALAVGVGGTILGAVIGRESWSAAALLAGSFLFDVWFIAPDPWSAAMALIAAALLAMICLAMLPRPGRSA